MSFSDLRQLAQNTLGRWLEPPLGEAETLLDRLSRHLFDIDTLDLELAKDDLPEGPS
jgi:hypothetical protein